MISYLCWYGYFHAYLDLSSNEMSVIIQNVLVEKYIPVYYTVLIILEINLLLGRIDSSRGFPSCGRARDSPTWYAGRIPIIEPNEKYQI